MRKLVWCGGSSFELQNGEAPSPGPGEVLVRVKAVGVCATDVHILGGTLSFARPPMILGHEIAGEVASTGSRVDDLRSGERVTVDSVVGCGRCWFCEKGSAQFCTDGFELGINHDGACQDFIVVPRRNVYRIPASISDEEAAILDMEVWAAVRRCAIRPRDAVLILGDGPAGMIGCQVARLFGAGHVTLAGRSAPRLKFAETLRVADRYVSADLGIPPPTHAERRGFDCVCDFAGTAQSLASALTAVRPGGRVLLYGVHECPVPQFDANQVVLKDLTVYGSLSDREGWDDVIALAASRELRLAPLITHRFPLESAPEAYDFVRRKKDGVVKAVLLL